MLKIENLFVAANKGKKGIINEKNDVEKKNNMDDVFACGTLATCDSCEICGDIVMKDNQKKETGSAEKKTRSTVTGNLLQGINLNIKKGEIHALMGPNGAGKSTLGYTITGYGNYELVSGEMFFNDEKLSKLKSDERAKIGIFLAFQNPPEIPGVTSTHFMKAALNSIRKKNNLKELDSFEFMSLIKEKIKLLKFDDNFLNREFNVGLSGGEKKKNEILQMLLLEPKLVILDEIDSGLDVDAMRIVANCVNEMSDNSRSFLLITHHNRILKQIKPDFVHIMIKGKIVKSGGPELAEKVEAEGYKWIEEVS